MNTSVSLENILFLDIETVSEREHYHQLSADWKKLWDHKAQFLRRQEESNEELYTRAGIYAEFGKVVCISMGTVRYGKTRIQSFYGLDEKEILTSCANYLNRFFRHPKYLLCAHNGKEFDFPFLARRLLVQQIPLPELLNIAGKKPWEIRHLDTMELWKFGDYKHYTSLELLAQLLGIESPKNDLTGADVHRVYYQEGNIQRIRKYCEKDVRTLIQLYQRYHPKQQQDLAQFTLA